MQRVMLWPLVLAASLGCVQQVRAQVRGDAIPQCHALLGSVRDQLPFLQASHYVKAATLQWVNGIANRLARFGGAASSALGGTAAHTSLARYANLVDDTSAFTTAMRQEYADTGLRLSAYGALLGEDIEQLTAALDGIRASQRCYRSAYETLLGASLRGELAASVVRRQHEAISDDMAQLQQMLTATKVHMAQHLHAFNAALQVELHDIGIDIHGQASAQAAPNATLEQLALMSTEETLASAAGNDAAVRLGLHDLAAMGARYVALRNDAVLLLQHQQELANYLQRVPLPD